MRGLTVGRVRVLQRDVTWSCKHGHVRRVRAPAGAHSGLLLHAACHPYSMKLSSPCQLQEDSCWVSCLVPVLWPGAGDRNPFPLIFSQRTSDQPGLANLELHSTIVFLTSIGISPRGIDPLKSRPIGPFPKCAKYRPMLNINLVDYLDTRASHLFFPCISFLME